jgi:hypothetical protein
MDDFYQRWTRKRHRRRSALPGVTRREANQVRQGLLLLVVRTLLYLERAEGSYGGFDSTRERASRRCSARRSPRNYIWHIGLDLLVWCGPVAAMRGVSQWALLEVAVPSVKAHPCGTAPSLQETPSVTHTTLLFTSRYTSRRKRMHLIQATAREHQKEINHDQRPARQQGNTPQALQQDQDHRPKLHRSIPDAAVLS